MSRVTTTVIPSQLRSARLLMTMLRRISLSFAPVHTHTRALTHAQKNASFTATSKNTEGIRGRRHNGSGCNTPTHNRPLVQTRASLCDGTASAPCRCWTRAFFLLLEWCRSKRKKGHWSGFRGVATVRSQTGSGGRGGRKGRGRPSAERAAY